MKRKSTTFSQITILILLVILGTVAFAFRYISSRDTYLEVGVLVSGTEWWRTEHQPPSWLADSFKVGDAEYSASGKKLAELVSIKRYEEGSNKIVYATVSLLVSRQPKINKYFFRQQPLEVGTFIDLSFGGTKLTGSVVDIQNSDSRPQFSRKEITVKLIDRYPWFADSIQVGDEKIDEVTGQKEIRVIEKRVTLADSVGYTSRGQIVASKNPLKRDIELKLDLQVINRGGIDYYSFFQPVKIGNTLYFSMPRYNLYEAHVTQVE